MELASRSRIKLLGSKLNDLNVQRVKINHSGFNARYTMLVDGVYSHPISRRSFADSLSINIYQQTGPLCFHGELLSITQQCINEQQWAWQLLIGSSLHRLDNDSAHHLYIDQNVEEIIKALFEESRIDCQFMIKNPLKKIPYTAQGGVSDYDFLKRLCVDHGLVFYYRHDETLAQLYLTDRPEIAEQYRLNYVDNNGLNDHQPHIRHWSSQQNHLPEQVRLRAYKEDDITTLWECITENKSGIKGSGLINLTLSQSIDSASECEQRAHLLQQQLDWQRHVYQIECSATKLQPGDQVEFIHPKQAEPFMVFDVRSSLDEAPIEGEPHPFRQKAYLIPISQTYKAPCLETQIRTDGLEIDDMPEGWIGMHKMPIPSLELAIISGNDEQNLCLDEQGRYQVQPLFDSRKRTSTRSSHFIRQAQPGAGLPKTSAQGVHLPLNKGTRVILAHLDNQIDKPFILGVHPEQDQISPVNPYHLDLLSLKHRNGSGLEFKENSYQNQSIHLYTEERAHGLTLKTEENRPDIEGQSNGEIRFQSKKDSHISSKESHLDHQSFLHKAEEDYSLICKARLNIDSGGHLHVNCGQDWQALTKSGEFKSESEEKLAIEGKTIAVKAQHMKAETKNMSVHAGKSLNIEATKSIGLKTLESQAIFKDQHIAFKATKINIKALNILLNQNGMANSGSAFIPKIE